MKIYLFGLLFAVVFGLAAVTTANTIPQDLPAKPSQDITKVPFSQEELLNASPFDPVVQKQTFYAVAKIMYIKHLAPEIALPAVIVNTTIPVEKIPEYTGIDFGSNKIHYFSYLKNTILLSEDAKVHNLAHEMAHYFQFHYRLKGDLKNMARDPEPEAVRIQHFFRAENGTVAARHTLKQPSL